eukprot:s2074_g2.t1
MYKVQDAQASARRKETQGFDAQASAAVLLERCKGNPETSKMEYENVFVFPILPFLPQTSLSVPQAPSLQEGSSFIIRGSTFASQDCQTCAGPIETLTGLKV